MSKLLLKITLLNVLLIVAGCSKKEEVNDIKGFKLTLPAITETDASQTVDLTLVPDGTLAKAFDVDYEIVEGTAKFIDDLEAASGTLTFSPGQPEQVISLTITGDTFSELTEDFELRITFEGKTTSQLILIADDDPMEPILEDADGFYTSGTHPSMVPVWSDEFNDTTLNLDYWTYELGNGCDKGVCGWGNNELEVYTDDTSNVKTQDGRLVITARKGSEYTSARIITQDKVEKTFGRIDVRARLPKGQGIWPAIWMLGANIDEVSWPACGETDIMELVGHQPSVVHGTAHYDDNGYKSSGGSKTLVSGDFSEKFHVFTLMWDRDRIEWYVDNEKYKTFTSSGIATWPFNQDFFFIMNVAVGGNWPGNPDETTLFPQRMEVDYIRVFR